MLSSAMSETLTLMTETASIADMSTAASKTTSTEAWTPSQDFIGQVEQTIHESVTDESSRFARLRGTPHIVRLISILATNEYR